MKRTVAGLIVMLIVLAGCSEPGTPTVTPPGEQGAIEHPTGPEPVLVISHEGGMLTAAVQVSSLPFFVLVGDGRVIMLGAQTLEYPGPALPPLIERTLTEKGVQLVLEAVRGTGLFASDLDLRGAANRVTDAPDTVFTLDAGGAEVTVRVYGLGMIDPLLGMPPGMSSSELEAHGVLTRLSEALMTLDAWLPADAWATEAWQAFEPDAFRLYVRDVSGEPVEDGGLPEQVRDWPTDDDPVSFGEEQEGFGDGTRCAVVEGELGATWLEELSAATQITLWTDDGGRRFSVRARPLLPGDERDCPEPFGA